MANLLSSLEIGKRALNAQRLAITVTGHNLANVNTPNFARQRAEFDVGINGTPPSSVEVAQIRQIRDKALDERVRRHAQDFAKADAQSNRLGELEALFGDLPGSGITDTLSEFWDGWQDLTVNPESEAARLTIIERGETLALELRRFHGEFLQTHININAEISNKVSQINQIAESIAELNGQIITTEGSGVNANDERDRREQLLVELSEHINIRLLEEENGSAKVLIGGVALVDGIEASSLETDTVSAASRGITSSLANASVTEITALGGTEISITSGELAGLIEVRDVQIPELAGRFDLLADVLMDEINQLHRTGFGLDRTTDLDFFSGNSITDISVNPLLQTNPEKLGVAGVPDAEGDNQIALAIAQKRSDRLFTDGRETFEEFNNSTISIIGVQSQQAQREVENNELLVQQLTLFQESVSGVSIDEELSQMIQFQRAYEAAARYISTIDQLLETLVNI